MRLGLYHLSQTHTAAFAYRFVIVSANCDRSSCRGDTGTRPGKQNSNHYRLAGGWCRASGNGEERSAIGKAQRRVKMKDSRGRNEKTRLKGKRQEEAGVGGDGRREERECKRAGKKEGACPMRANAERRRGGGPRGARVAGAGAWTCARATRSPETLAARGCARARGGTRVFSHGPSAQRRARKSAERYAAGAG